MTPLVLNFIYRIAARLKAEPIVVAGTLTSLAAVLGSVENWKAAVPALVAWAMRQYVTPAAKAEADAHGAWRDGHDSALTEYGLN